MRHICLHIILFLISGNVLSQDLSPASEIEKINKAYLNQRRIEMSMIYEAFSSYTSKEPVDKQQGIVKRDGELMYNQIAFMESLHTNKYNVVVDNENKEIAIMAVLNSKTPMDYSNLLGDLEKFVSICKSVTLVDVGKYSREIRMIMPDASEYTQVFIKYDVRNYLLEKMVLFMRKEDQVTQESPKDRPRLEISYTKMNLHPKFSADEFDKERFVEISESKYKGKGKYSGYNVMSQID